MALTSSLSFASLSSASRLTQPAGINLFADPNAKPGTTVYQSPYDSFTVGTDGMDTIYLNYGGEVYAGAGHDTIYGGYTSGPQTIDAGAGDDIVFSGWGNDTLYGGTGNDWLDGSLGNDKIYGGEGRDKLFGGNGSDQLYGGAGDDTLWSGSSQSSYGMFDVLGDYHFSIAGLAAFGAVNNGTADALLGDAGRDTFYLEGGNVVASGYEDGPGSGYSHDTFIAKNSSGVDHYYIGIGVDGGHVDMRALGTMTGYEHYATSYGLFEKFVFGQDIVIVQSTGVAATFDWM